MASRCKRPNLCTFTNFGASTPSNISWLSANVDINDDTSYAERAMGPFNYTALLYMLAITMEVPSAKAAALAKHCGGLPEAAFLHFRYDTAVTLPVGHDLPGSRHVKKVVPGWCPAPNCTVPSGEKASATRLEQARVPIYYWAPPVADYAINPSEPCHRDFLSASWVPSQIRASGTRGVWFDTMSPQGPPGAARTSPLVEFAQGSDAYFAATQALMKDVKTHAPAGSLVLGNAWFSNPLEIDGYERESWLNALSNSAQTLAAIRSSAEGAAQQAVQQLQYNPMFDPALAPFGVNASFTERSRDQMLALGSYYLASRPNSTYFGYGSHPYDGQDALWASMLGALNTDLGVPAGEAGVAYQKRAPSSAHSVLVNADFTSGFDHWETAQPVVVDASAHPPGGGNAARIDSRSHTTDNINKQFVELEPNSTYTLGAWLKTSNVSGLCSAEAYMWCDSGEGGASLGAPQQEEARLCATGTGDWSHTSSVFHTPTPSCGTWRVNFRVDGSPGTAWFGGFSLVRGSYPDITVFSRRFTSGAAVYVRPSIGQADEDLTAAAVTLNLSSPTGSALHRLHANGSVEAPPATQLQLRAAEAAILVARD
jgi:hypothetical protein